MAAVKEALQGKRRHKLMPADVRARIPALGAQDGLGGEAVVHVKFFCPYGRGTWYFTEFDGEDTLYGYCVSQLGPDCDEWGYSSLSEMAAVTVFGGVPAIERDCGYGPVKVSEVKEIEGAYA